MDLDPDLDVPYRRGQTRPSLRSRDQHSSLDGLDAKVVVMGNTAVGKTSLVRRYTEDKFVPASTTSTTGAFFVTKKVVVDGLKVRLQLWDTAGQERFRSMAPMYYRGASAAILVYDVTDASTFADVKIWLEELKRNRHPTLSSSEEEPLIIYIVGAKADLGHSKRAVSLDQARKSLHTWFPPPRKPPPTPPTPSDSSFGRSVSGFSYIRPRFTSLTTSLSVPSAPQAEPPSTALTRANSARVVPVGARSNGDMTGARRRTPGNGARERRWSDAMMWDEAMREREEDDPQPTSPDDDSVNGEEGEDDDASWGLEKGMQLFEVSAKDNLGVQKLFGHLISSIIRQRHVIEREKRERERDSVVLNASVPTWESVDNLNNGRTTGTNGGVNPAKNNGWSCCSS